MDPLAAQGGQDMLSPYQAMGDNPVSFLDPGGTVHNRSDYVFVSPAIPGGPSVTNGYYSPSINLANFSLVGQWIMSSDNGEEVLMETFGQSTTGGDAIATNLTMGEGNGSGGGASDDAGGDPPGRNDKGNGGDPQSDNGNNKSPLQDMKDNPPNHPDYKAPKSGPRKVLLHEEKDGLIVKEMFGCQVITMGIMLHIGMSNIQVLMAAIRMFIHPFQLQLKSALALL